MAPRARPPIGYERRRPEETVLYPDLLTSLRLTLAIHAQLLRVLGLARTT